MLSLVAFANLKAFREFDEAGRMRPSPLCDRSADVLGESVKITLLTRDRAGSLADRCPERTESATALTSRKTLSAAT